MKQEPHIHFILASIKHKNFKDFVRVAGLKVGVGLKHVYLRKKETQQNQK